jgi:GNAT superfamily N-acetyltransferase
VASDELGAPGPLGEHDVTPQERAQAERELLADEAWAAFIGQSRSPEPNLAARAKDIVREEMGKGVDGEVSPDGRFRYHDRGTVSNDGGSVRWRLNEYNSIVCSDLSVTEDRRRQGYGRDLLAQVREIGVRLGADRVVLEASPTNEAAIGLFRTMGCRHVSEVYQLDLDGSA